MLSGLMAQNNNINPKICMYRIASVGLTELGVTRLLGGIEAQNSGSGIGPNFYGNGCPSCRFLGLSLEQWDLVVHG
jgi:hypothetical protein